MQIRNNYCPPPPGRQPGMSLQGTSLLWSDRPWQRAQLWKAELSLTLQVLLLFSHLCCLATGVCALALPFIEHQLCAWPSLHRVTSRRINFQKHPLTYQNGGKGTTQRGANLTLSS